MTHACKSVLGRYFFLFAILLVVCISADSSAQDYDAVKNRLIDAVREGEITLRQAADMMDALKESAEHERHHHDDDDEDDDDDEREMRFKKTVDKIKALVHAGKLSRKEAHEKLKAMERAFEKEEEDEIHFRHREEDGNKKKKVESRIEKKDGKEFSEEDYELIQKKIIELVRAGKLSREDAHKKLIAIKKAMGEKKERREISERREMERRESERRKRIRIERERSENRKSEESRNYAEMARRYYAAEKKLAELVESGKITKKQAVRRIAEMKRDLAKKRAESSRKQEGRKSSNGERESRERENPERRWADFKRRIEIGLKNGTISREKAHEMMSDFRKKMNDESVKVREEQKRSDYRAAERALKAAVEAGRISKEQAERRLLNLRYRLWGDKNQNREKSNREKSKREKSKRESDSRKEKRRRVIDI